MKKILLLVALSLSSFVTRFASEIRADEGMWMINNLSERTDSILRSLGLELTHDQLYSETNPSLNDAIVMFGGFCSGVVVSNEGLVFTNHHCGYSSIQDHSTTKHDYLENGFFAKSYKDELPNPELYVAFHLRTVDVTDRVLQGVTDDMDRSQRRQVVDSISEILTAAVLDTVNHIYGEITPYYKSHKYYMSVYQRFDDVRLVFAPPQCLGKFGGDTDNWVWPRQTCDFSVFRIYTDQNNRPAEYNKNNKPLRPKSYAHVSIQGYQPGSYCMTLGYPGSTERYLSSYGIENEMKNVNAVRYQVRGVKQEVMKMVMNIDPAIRIMYSSKYAESSNYWKNALGQNQALTNLNVVDEKRQLERAMPQYILDSLRVLYTKNDTLAYVNTMIEESFVQGSDILQFALMSMVQRLNDNSNDDNSLSDEFRKKLEKTYRDIDIPTDKAIFAALISNFRKNVDQRFWPNFVQGIDVNCHGNINMFLDNLYSSSKLTNKKRLAKVKSLDDLYEDPMFEVAFDVLTYYFYTRPQGDIDYWEGELEQNIMKTYKDKEYYPDANFTLRLSYGTILPLDLQTLRDARETYYTLPASLLAKNDIRPVNDDFKLIPSVRKWLESRDFGDRYKDPVTGDMQLCFLSSNDITGGNSGSGMFDGKGRLIGLAFDGNWEAMSGDYKFDDRLQRCIGVDIRYVLSVIEKYGKGQRLINELTLE